MLLKRTRFFILSVTKSIVASRADVKHSAYSQAMHMFYFCMLLVGGLSPKPHVMQSRLCGCQNTVSDYALSQGSLGETAKPLCRLRSFRTRTRRGFRCSMREMRKAYAHFAISPASVPAAHAPLRPAESVR